MLSRDQTIGVSGVFVVIAAFKLSGKWKNANAAVRARAAEELTRLMTRSARRVCVDIYISQGLNASCDYFLRVHAYDLAEAQSYIKDFSGTTLGTFSQATEIWLGLTKPRQYITREKAAMLNEQLNAAAYEADTPRFAIVIPVKKSARWWNMSENERLREIEIHTEKAIPFLTRVKRALYHSAGLDEMDFITYFETADLNAFHELAIALMGIRENEFHNRWGQPILLGIIQDVPTAARLLCN